MTGPFDSEREARELPAVRAVYAAFRADPGLGRMTPHNRRMLGRACEAAGVAMGRYDDRIIEWLAGFEPQICAVIAGLISRAHDAGTTAGPAPAVTLTAGQLATVLDALADAEEYRRKEAAQWCADCESSPAEACGQHLDDLDAAQAYEALGAGLGGDR